VRRDDLRRREVLATDARAADGGTRAGRCEPITGKAGNDIVSAIGQPVNVKAATRIADRTPGTSGHRYTGEAGAIVSNRAAEAVSRGRIEREIPAAGVGCHRQRIAEIRGRTAGAGQERAEVPRTGGHSA